MSERFDLTAARLNRGLTIREAAAHIGVSNETLRRVEAGHGAHPGNAKKIADFFGIKVTDLLAEPTERVA